MSSFEDDLLFHNYFQFMKFFRGEVRRTKWSISVESEKPEFTFSVPLSREGISKFLDDGVTHTIFVKKEFNSEPIRNWKPCGALTFMEKKSESIGSDLRTKTEYGNSKRLADDFSIAQCRGFLESPAAFAAWSSWLTDANERNIGNDDVTFHVAYLDDKSVSGLITVKTSSCIGIYGVATDPAYRKRGLGTLLLMQALKNSNQSNVIGLQVESGSYAHNYYKKLGFEDTLELLRYKK